MPEWESLDDGVLVYGRGTPEETKLEGWETVCAYVNDLERSWREKIRRAKVLEEALGTYERERNALSMALSEETRQLRETQADQDVMIDALMSALGTTRQEYLLEKTPLYALNTLIAQRDAARDVVALIAERCRNALGITHDKYGSLPLVSMLVESRDAAMEALWLWKEWEKNYAEECVHVINEGYDETIESKRRGLRAREAREKVLKDAGE